VCDVDPPKCMTHELQVAAGSDGCQQWRHRLPGTPGSNQSGRTTQPATGNTMKATMRYAAPWLAAAAIGGDDCSRAHRKRRHESPRAVRHRSPQPVHARLPRFQPRRSEHHERSSGHAFLIATRRQTPWGEPQIVTGGRPVQRPRSVEFPSALGASLQLVHRRRRLTDACTH